MADTVDKQGSVLCAAEILELCTAPSDPLMRDYDEGSLIGAKYDLRMATTGLVLPNGIIIEPTDKGYEEEILLEPGGTIFVSTREQLRLPLHLVGNMSIKGELSRKGILSLTGLIVDPGYHQGSSSDGRLHFRLANLGSKAVVLQPGITKIASIQFVRLSNPATEPPPGGFPDIWAHKEELAQGLGFIEDIRAVKAQVRKLSLDFERQRRSVNYVVLGGILVILATMLGVAISGLLSLGADSNLIESAKNVIPDERVGQVLAVVLILGLGAISAGVVIALAYRNDAGVVDLDERGLARQEALRGERVRRYRRFGTYCVLAAGAIAMAIGVPIALEAPFWVAPLAAFVTLLVFVLLSGKAWKPITPKDVQDRLREWQGDEADPTNVEPPSAA